MDLLFEYLLTATIRSALLFAAALVTLLVMRRLSAAQRHLMLCATMAAAILVMVTPALLPSWRVLPADAPRQVLAPAADWPAVEDRPLAVEQDRGSNTAPVAAAVASPARGIPWKAVLVCVWLGGAAIFALRLVIARFKLWRVSRQASPVTSGRVFDVLFRVSEQLHLRRPPRLLLTGTDTMPMTFGVLRPVVLIPASAEQWSADRLNAVVLHELAHVRRRDCLAQLVASIAVALYWPNPLSHLAYRQLSGESERASDDMVLANGEGASGYADQLFQVATGHSSSAFLSTAAIAMAHPLRLEGRVAAILDSSRNRRRITRLAAALLMATFAAVAIPLAVAAPGETVAAKVVDDAVTVVSTCVEGDPRIGREIGNLRRLDEADTVAELKQHLDDSVATRRRAALHLLTKAQFRSIEQAIPKLLELTKHEEEITRGMAAIALGQYKAAQSGDALAEMTLHDSSPYARRCAAYALGLLGDPRSADTLNQASQDENLAVRDNAKLAIGMLRIASATGPASARTRLQAPSDVITLTLQDNKLAKAACFLDVETGTVIAAPPEAGDWVSRPKGLFSGEEASSPKLDTWTAENGIDIICVPEGLAAMDGRARFARAELGTFENPPANLMLGWSRYTREGSVSERAVADWAQLPGDFLFRTKDGSWGVMRVLEATTNPEGFRISYKLLQARDLAAATAQATTRPMQRESSVPQEGRGTPSYASQEIAKQITQTKDADLRQQALARLNALLRGDGREQLDAIRLLMVTAQVRYDRSEIIARLRELLGSKNATIRVAVIGALPAGGGSKEDVGLLEPLVDDPDPAIRAALPATMVLLSNRELAESTQKVISRLLDDPELNVRRRTIHSLWSVPLTAEQEQRVITLLDDPELRYDTIYYCLSTRPTVSLKVAKALAELLQLSDTDHGRLTWGLSHRSSTEAADLVSKTLATEYDNSVDSYVRENCVRGLKQLNTPSAREKLAEIEQAGESAQ